MIVPAQTRPCYREGLYSGSPYVSEYMTYAQLTQSQTTTLYANPSRHLAYSSSHFHTAASATKSSKAWSPTYPKATLSSTAETNITRIQSAARRSAKALASGISGVVSVAATKLREVGLRCVQVVTSPH
jgi:hypothetical protein